MGIEGKHNIDNFFDQWQPPSCGKLQSTVCTIKWANFYQNPTAFDENGVRLPMPSVSNNNTACSSPVLSLPLMILVPIQIPNVLGSNVCPRSKASASPSSLLPHSKNWNVFKKDLQSICKARNIWQFVKSYRIENIRRIESSWELKIWVNAKQELNWWYFGFITKSSSNLYS